MAPRTFLFSGKAAPAYRLAKLIIKFINNLAVLLHGIELCEDASKRRVLLEITILHWRRNSFPRATFQPDLDRGI